MSMNEQIIYHLCCKNQWFTGGSQESYGKLFQLCKAGYVAMTHFYILKVKSTNQDTLAIKKEKSRALSAAFLAPYKLHISIKMV